MNDLKAARQHFIVAGFAMLLVIAQLYYSRQKPKHENSTATSLQASPADSTTGGHLFIMQPEQ
jgi:hypothetical protein